MSSARGRSRKGARAARAGTLGLALALAAALQPAAAAADEKGADPARRPGIVLLIMDDMRWDTLGYAGNPIVRTPNLDRLAARGVRFTNAFATTSICYSSRASFLTGQYERRHGIGDFRTPLSKEAFADTFPARLRKNGYRTAFVGKWGLGGPLPAGEYDHWKGFSGQGRYYVEGRKHMTDHLASQALEFLDGAAGDDRPFCLQVSFKAAHCQDGDPWPFQPARRYRSLYRDVRIPSPPTATESHFRALPEFLRDSEARRRWRVRFATPELYQKSVRDYYRLITGVDEVVGRIVTRLDARGLLDSTVIIFSSDQGFYLGERGLAGKWFMHEESIRIPLLLVDPRLPESLRGRDVTEDALNIDVAPTILDLAEIAPPDVMQGRSLVPLLRGRRVPWRGDWFYEHLFTHPRIPRSEGVRSSRWKYVRWIDTDPCREELYDLLADPLETRNTAADPAYGTVLADLRTRWEYFREALR